jgi:predicted amidohydrolase
MVCPEFALTGTPNSPKEASAYAIVLNDAAVIKKLSGIARQNGLYIVLGLIEKNHVNLYITICIVGPYGLEGSYRKIHKSEHEKSWASSGKNHFQYFDLPFGRVGLLAGEDVLFPESTVCLASDAVDLICICAAITEPKPIALPSSPTHVPGSYPGDDSMHWHLIRNRAVECSTYIAFSNQGGKYMGYSGVFSDWDYPRYEDVVDGQGESLLQLEMDISEENGYAKTLVRRKDWLMTKRLHYLYKKLIVKQSFVVK